MKQYAISGVAMNLRIRGTFVAMQWMLPRCAEEIEIEELNKYFRRQLRKLRKNYIEVKILEEVITLKKRE